MKPLPTSRSAAQRVEDRTPEWQSLLEQAYRQKIPYKPGVMNYMNQPEVAAQAADPRFNTPGRYAFNRLREGQAKLTEFMEMLQMANEPVVQITPEEFFWSQMRSAHQMPLQRRK